MCTDYAYNYGRRRSPSILDMLQVFQATEASGKFIGSHVAEYKHSGVKKPLEACLSLLCSMPSSEAHLIDDYFEPLLENQLIDKIFENCKDPDTGRFDMGAFSKQVSFHMAEAKRNNKTNEALGWPGDKRSDKMKSKSRVSIGKNYWTVLKKSRTKARRVLEPPAPFLDDMRPLNTNPFINAHSVNPMVNTGRKSRRKADKRVFGAEFESPFDGMEDEQCRLDPETNEPTLECFPYKMPYHRGKNARRN